MEIVWQCANYKNEEQITKVIGMQAHLVERGPTRVTREGSGERILNMHLVERGPTRVTRVYVW